MGKRAFIIHGWQGHSKQGWYPWLGDELSKRGFTVIIPDMPDAKDPKPEEWVLTIEELVKKPDDNTYLIGHSAGANAIMRYVSNGNKVGGIVLVAPWPSLKPEKRKYGKQMGARWLFNEYDWKAVSRNAKSIVAIFGSNDPYVDFNDSDVFRNNLHAKIVIEKGKKHLSESHGVMQLPSALEAIIEQSGLK